MWWITGSVAPWTIKWQRFCWTVNRECISTCARRQCSNSSRNIPPVEMTIIRSCLALSSLKNGSGLILSQSVVPWLFDAVHVVLPHCNGSPKSLPFHLVGDHAVQHVGVRHFLPFRLH